MNERDGRREGFERARQLVGGDDAEIEVFDMGGGVLEYEIEADAEEEDE